MADADVLGGGLMAAIAITAAFVGDALSGDEEITSDTDSRRADDLRSAGFASGRRARGVSEVIVVRYDERNVITGHWEAIDDDSHWQPWMDITLTKQASP